MPIKQSFTFTCDLCGREKKADSQVKPPAKWVTFEEEDRHLERSFHTVCLCEGCLASISNAAKRAGLAL